MKDDRPDWEKRLDEKTAGLDPNDPEDRKALLRAHADLIMGRAGLSGTKQRSTKKWWQFWK
jgi:hypothetical protein